MIPSSQSISEIARRTGSITILSMILTLLFLGSVMSSGWHVALKAEYGALELASFICLATAAIVSLAFYREGTIKLWSVPMVFALLAMREMDFQDWWFEPGLLRTEIFSSSAPVWHKSISGIAMLAIAVALLNLLFRGARPLWYAVRAGKPWAVAILLSGCSVVVALISDGAEKNFATLNITLSPLVSQIMSYAEEVVEFTFSFLLVVAVILFARQAKGVDS